MKRIILLSILIQLPLIQHGQIIDHSCTRLDYIPLEWIASAKQKLHIAYGHTSHGSQLTEGMTGLVSFKGSTYSWNNGGTGGALDLHDYAMAGDLGNPDRTSWATETRTYLAANSDVNVIIWSWCSQVIFSSEADINLYLNLMSGLERDYPNVKFVYMTGFLDGTGLTGNLHLRNEQIRKYCRDNKKILYDYADIESYDPDGLYYLDKKADCQCNYDSNGDGTLDANWAIAWQNSHTMGVDWYYCNAAHSYPINGNMKAYAAWNLWARIAGWNGKVTVTGIREERINNISIRQIVTPYELKILLNDELISWDASLYNLQGNLLSSKPIQSSMLFFDISSLSSGIYFVVLSNGSQRLVEKVIKQ